MAKEHYGNAIPSFIFHGMVKVCEIGQLTDREKLREFTDCLCQAIGMVKMCENPLVGELPSDVFGVSAYSVLQPIMTSHISMDTWPEKCSFVLVVHSCKEFDPKTVVGEVRSFFKGAEILREDFFSLAYRERKSEEVVS